MIDKITAGILYGYGYKLLRVETGQMFEITGIDLSSITKQIFLKLSINGKYWGDVKVSEIGTTYKILARPLEMLTKEIEGKVPLIECAKILWEFDDWRLHNIHSMKIARADTVLNRWFDFEDGVFKAGDDAGNFHVKNQLSLFQYLYSLNFNIGFPENTTTDLI